MYGEATITVSVRRNTSTGYRFAKATLVCMYDRFNSQWIMVDFVEQGVSNLSVGSTVSGITWTVTTAGQIQYATDNMTGTGYTGASRVSVSSIAA